MLPTLYDRRLRLAHAIQEGSLYVMLVWLPFSKAAIEILFGVMLCGWLLQYAWPGGWRLSVWSRPVARFPLLALLSYLTVCGVSILVSDFPRTSLTGYIGKTVEYALLFVMAAELGQQPRAWRYGLLLLLVGALLACSDGLAQEFLHRDPLRHYRLDVYGRMYAPYQNPNDLATFLIVVIPLLCSQLLMASRRWTIPLAGFLAFAVGCVIRTGARGALVGLIVGLIAMALCLWRKRMPALLALAGGLAMVGAAALRHLSGKPDIGVRDRVFMWQAGWDMLKARPILGQGINTFMSNYLYYWVGGEHSPRYAHNCYLQAAAETGLLGLASFLWLLGAILWTVVRGAVSLDVHPSSRRFLAGCVGGIAAFLVQAAVDTNFYSLRHAALFWTLAGLAVGCAWSQSHAAVNEAPVPQPSLMA